MTCEIECKKCDLNSCTECIDNTKPVSNCKCDSSNFLNFNDKECQSCSGTCKSCVTNNNKCTECNNGIGLNTTTNTCSITCDS